MAELALEPRSLCNSGSSVFSDTQQQPPTPWGLGHTGGQSSDPDRKLSPRDLRERQVLGYIGQHGGAGSQALSGR